jgi:putative acyl-CoA dehydrogenase
VVLVVPDERRVRAAGPGAGRAACFLVPRVLKDGTLTAWRLLRRKEKLGNRSSATAEVELEGTWGARLGEEGRGVRILLGTVSATRLDAVLGGVPGRQRAGRGARPGETVP